MKQVIIIAALLLAACASETPPVAVETISTSEVDESAFGELRVQQEMLLNTYFTAYKSKDVEAMLALFDDDILGALYPDTVFGRGIDAAEPGIRGDYEQRPNAWADMPKRYRIARDKWMAVGESVNGDERAPLFIIFDLDEAGEKIEATYTQIGHSSFITGASVAEPTQGMVAAANTIFERLADRDFTGASKRFADGATLYAYPPVDLESQSPVIVGASDVASALSFKWGEGAWTPDVDITRYMQFVLAGIPAREGGFDRVALFTFDADPASPSYEKIIRVDVMGPSGG